MSEEVPRPAASRKRAPRTRVADGARFARDSRAVLDERMTGERGHEEREVTGDRELSDDERLEMFRDSIDQSVLPSLPQTDGFHTCWLTTSNPRDTIPWRLRLGYQLIQHDQLPGWTGAPGLDSPAYPGTIAVNEMLAARIPLSLYNRYMKEVHERKPLDEEQKLKQRIDLIRGQAEQLGSKVTPGDGTDAMVQRAPPMPDFDS